MAHGELHELLQRLFALAEGVFRALIQQAELLHLCHSGSGQFEGPVKVDGILDGGLFQDTGKLFFQTQPDLLAVPAARAIGIMSTREPKWVLLLRFQSLQACTPSRISEPGRPGPWPPF